MWGKLLSLKKVLIARDGISIGVIILGLLIAIFLGELAIRLIGVCISVLGALALFMGLSQRLRDNVESRFTPASKPDYKMTVKRDDSAKRQVVEGFEDSFGPEKKDDSGALETDENGYVTDGNFRIIRKNKSTTPQQSQSAREKTTPEVNIKPDEEEFSDNVSSVKFIPKQKEAAQAKPAAQDNKPLNGKKNKAEEIRKPSATVKPENTRIEENNTSRKEEINIPPAKETIVKEEKSEYKPATENESIASEEPARKPEKYREKQYDVSLSMLIEDQPVIGQEPRKEFEYYLTRVLKIIRSVTSTKTAAFLLVNQDKAELILESYDTDYESAIVKDNKIGIGNDVVSQIVVNEKPEILTEINPSAETDLIPYYTRSVGSSSFIGVPVFYNNSVIGVLCADTEVTDAYDSVTVSFLGHFTKLIGALLQSYTEKYELVQASRTLQTIGTFRDILSGNSINLGDICESAAEAAARIFEYTSLGVCVYDSASGSWKVKAFRSRREDETNMQEISIDLDDTVLGSAIVSGRTVFFSPVTNDYTRVYKGESNIEGGCFAAVPLKSMVNNFGALFIEGKSSTSITAYDISILETLGENAGISIDQLYCMKMLESSAIFDNATGVMNPPAFVRRLEEELLKSSDFGSSLSLCLFQIDNYASFNSSEFQERAERILHHVLDIVRKNLRPYDVFGKLDEHTFAIALSGMSLKDAQLWAERLRIEVARSVIEIRNRRFSVTISAGLAGASANETIEGIFNNAHKVLEISLNKMNSVSVFA